MISGQNLEMSLLWSCQPLQWPTPIQFPPQHTKGIFAGSSDWMQAPDAAAPYSMDSIIIEIHKSQVAMMAKKGANIVNQGDNHYSMIVVTIAPFEPY